MDLKLKDKSVVVLASGSGIGKGVALEFVRENATLAEAIHQLVMGSHHSLIVLNDEEKIVGVLKLTDVFEKFSRTIKAFGL